MSKRKEKDQINRNQKYSDALDLYLTNINDFKAFAISKSGSELENAFLKTICWCKGLCELYPRNPARLHLVSAWGEVINILALVPLCFYRQSYNSMRLLIEEILAWSFFESHPIEFKTSIKSSDYWVGREEIFKFHKQHTWQNYRNIEKMGIWANINRLYSQLSRYMHAQTFTGDAMVNSFESFKYDAQKVKDLIKLAAELDNSLSKYLGSMYQDAFSQFPPDYQKTIISGWSKNIIADLDLCI